MRRINVGIKSGGGGEKGATQKMFTSRGILNSHHTYSGPDTITMMYIIPRVAATSPSDLEKERLRLREQNRNRKGNDPVNKTNLSEIRTFRITGIGGTPNYSYLPIRLDSTTIVINEEECKSARNDLEQLTLGGQEQVKLIKPIPFFSCYNYVSTKKRNNVFMDGLRVEMCDTLKVLSAEIYINDNCTKRASSVGFRPSTGFFRKVGDSTRVMLGNDGNYTDILEIYHYKFKGDSKRISVLVVAEIPKEKVDVIQVAKRIVKEHSRKPWP